MNSKKRRILSTVANDVNTICTPLFEGSPISFFSYNKIYKKGPLCYLGSNPIWMEHMLDLQFLKEYPVKCAISAGYYITENIVPERMAIGKKILKADGCLTIVKEFNNYYETANYGTSLPNNMAFEYYLNNRDLLENFTLYFKDKANGLIKEAKKTQNLQMTDTQNIFIPRNEVLVKYDIIDNIATTRFFSDSDHCNYKLSPRETECLIYLLRGRTAKEIAKELEYKISHKSVEMYISRAQTKLGCSTKKELFDKAIVCGFLNLVKNSLFK